MIQVEWNKDAWVLWVQCDIWWWLGQSTGSLHPGSLGWHWAGLVYQPNQWLLTVWMWLLAPHPSSVFLLKIATHRTGRLGLGQSLLLLLDRICHLGPCLPQLVHARHMGGGGVVPPSSVGITCISKQYQVPGQSGVGFLAGDWDGWMGGGATKCLCLFRAMSATW